MPGDVIFVAHDNFTVKEKLLNLRRLGWSRNMRTVEEAHKNHSVLLKAVKVTCLLPNSAQLK